MNAFDRLHRADDIRAVFAARAVAHGPAMAVHARRRADEGPARATVVAGRKVGDAVRRNRAKRRLRAALHDAVAPRGLDVVVVGRSPALTADFLALVEEAERLLARASQRAGSASPGAGNGDERASRGAERPARSAR